MLTAGRLRELLDYDPGTGVFRWRVKKCNACPAGRRAGFVVGEGYRRIEIDGVTYPETHLAWCHVNGVFPSNKIDHKNRVTDDNRIDNLREATNSQNSQNQKIRSDSRSGYKGVTRHQNKGFSARIVIDGKRVTLGYFADPRDAYASYVAAAEKHYGEYARAE